MCIICNNSKEELNEVQEIVIENCENLTRFPLLNNLSKLTIKSCKNLRKIANISTLTKLNIEKCDNLSDLPPFPELLFIELKFCHNIKSIPYLDNLEEMYIIGNDAITRLDYQYNVKKLGLIECSCLREVKTMGKLHYFYALHCYDLMKAPLYDSDFTYYLINRMKI
jgi:hypothetical protein